MFAVTKVCRPHRELLLDRRGYVVLIRVVETRPQNRNLGSLPSPHRAFLLDRRGYVIFDSSGGDQGPKSESGILAHPIGSFGWTDVVMW